MWWRYGPRRDDSRVDHVTVLRAPRDGPQSGVGSLTLVAQRSGVIDVAHRRERPGPNHDGRVVVQIPTGVARVTADNAGDLVRSAWQPGVSVVVADMTTLGDWDEAGLASLLRAHGELARRQAELRLVVWSASLYAALQTAGISGQLAIYANVDAALRDP